MSSTSQTWTNSYSYESFSVCSLRIDTQPGNNNLYNAITKCCTTPIKFYQCWNYCGVEESQFPTWLGCIQEATNSTWGAACQRADQSPVITATGPYPSSYNQPVPPLGYTPPPTYTTSSTSNAPLVSRASWSVATNATTTLLSPTGGSNGNNSTPIGLASPTAVIQAGSPKALALSMGGIMCAFLLLSTLAL
jgi:hypothetical protein